MPAILNPWPVAFVPRQIMLEKHADEFPAVGKATKKKEKKKQKKSSPETMELVRSDGDLLTLRKEKARKVLLRSIAAYLERSGFSKALSALRAEAQLEADDPKAYHLELDEVTLSVLESSDYDTKCSIGWAEEQGSERSGVVKRNQEDNVHKSEGKIMLEDSPVEIKDKRRKKKSISNSSEENAQEVPKKAGCGTHEEPVMKSNVAGKDKKKRKHKMAIDQVDENTAIMDDGIIQDICKEKMEVSNEKNRDEKKKKRKEASNSIVENGGGNVDSVVVQASVQNPSEDVDAKKDKKKKRDKPTLTASEEVVGGTSCMGAREHATEEKRDSRNSDSQQLNGLVLDGRIDGTEKKVSKKRKRISYGETGLQDDNGTVVAESRQEKVDSVEEDKESETVQKVDTSLPGGARKKMKIEKEKDNTNGFLEKSPGDPLNLSVTKDDNGTPDQKKETENELVNGNIVNSLKEDGSSANAIKKGKHSAEPKTALAFQRVKIDEVKFADARLKDNSYWAKGGADAGYGAKAQEVLGQVRGRDFRHEKTKKKRGSYRGGQIDLQSHSIKFNYSDDE